MVKSIQVVRHFQCFGKFLICNCYPWKVRQRDRERDSDSDRERERVTDNGREYSPCRWNTFIANKSAATGGIRADCVGAI